MNDKEPEEKIFDKMGDLFDPIFNGSKIYFYEMKDDKLHQLGETKIETNLVWQ